MVRDRSTLFFLWPRHIDRHQATKWRRSKLPGRFYALIRYLTYKCQVSCDVHALRKAGYKIRNLRLRHWLSEISVAKDISHVRLICLNEEGGGECWGEEVRLHSTRSCHWWRSAHRTVAHPLGQIHVTMARVQPPSNRVPRIETAQMSRSWNKSSSYWSLPI